MDVSSVGVVSLEWSAGFLLTAGFFTVVFFTDIYGAVFAPK